MTALAPARFYISWPASTLGNNFGGYKLYRRPSRAVAEPWENVAFIAPTAGRSPSQTETYHNQFIDWEAGWRGSVSSARWYDGWDYAVTALNAATGIEDQIQINAISGANTLGSNEHPWIVSNAAPYLGFPLARSHRSARDESGMAFDPTSLAGRDMLVTRTRLELPARNQSIEFDLFSQDGEDFLRYWRAAAWSGRRMCLHLPLGDRVLGTLDTPSLRENSDSVFLAAEGSMFETGRTSAVANHNLPCGVMLDGSADYLSVASNAALNPGSSGFSYIVAGAFDGSAGNEYFFSKGNIGGGQGYGFASTSGANQVQYLIVGSSTLAQGVHSSSTWYNGQPHVAVVTSTGSAQALYLDGAVTSAVTSITHGSVTNSVAMAFGGNNGGASSLSAFSPGQSFAYYNRVLTADEAKAASYYLLGYPGYRMPYGPQVFIDLRDDRCWNGLGATAVDLSGNGRNATIVSAPPVRGNPWSLKDLEKFG